ncbi:hypothetical protein ACIPF8_22960 [Collimonas sp. NPDC087041]|uniref:COG4315 family predicted lipoprotein n=1 Tax=Collimonas sp. NPDC087041 TaxID=3363960 RepID=UPI0037FAAFBB
MRKNLYLLLTCLGLTLPALAETPKTLNGKLVDENGLTLYVFDEDTIVGKSACNEGCTATWPPAISKPSDKTITSWSFVTRIDGKQQWTYKGHPVYRFVMDHKTGDTNGDGIAGVWHTAKP